MQPSTSYPAISAYALRLADALQKFDWSVVDRLADALLSAWHRQSTVWVCGNGGSAGNASHWANDFLYPIAKRAPRGIRIHSLTANPAVTTCLGNDLGYDKIFSSQLQTLASPGDLFLAFSGSGNSPNIVEGLKTAHKMGLKTCAIVGFDGGAAIALADIPIHFAIDDMQVAEDTQMVVCHALVQALVDEPNRPTS